MIGKRFIDGDKLLAMLQDGVTDGRRIDLSSWLKRQPKMPKLLGRQRAADIIGVGSPYITVLVKNGDLTPVRVDGGPDVYEEAETKAVAKVYKKRKRKRSGSR